MAKYYGITVLRGASLCDHVISRGAATIMLYRAHKPNFFFSGISYCRLLHTVGSKLFRVILSTQHNWQVLLRHLGRHEELIESQTFHYANVFLEGLSKWLLSSTVELGIKTTNKQNMIHAWDLYSNSLVQWRYDNVCWGRVLPQHTSLQTCTLPSSICFFFFFFFSRLIHLSRRLPPLTPHPLIFLFPHASLFSHYR